MLVLDRLSTLVDRLERLPSETLIFGVEVLRALSACVAFMLLVVAWDTLPSLPPVKSDTTKIGFVARHAESLMVIQEELFIVKSAPYTITRTLHANGLEVEVPATNMVLKTGGLQKIIYVPHLDPSKRWCLYRTVSWTPGLSIRKHSYTLDPICTKE